MNKFKGVIFDIDNTLYSHKEEIVPSLTIKAIESLKEEGYKIGLCTSRFPKEFYSLPKDVLALADMIIAGTGCLLLEDGEIIESYTLPNEISEKLITYLDSYDNIKYLWISKDGEYHFASEPLEKTKIHTKEWMGETPSIRKWDGEELINISYYNFTDEQTKEIDPLFPTVSIEKWGEVGQINTYGVDKGFGVKRFAEHFNLKPEEIICFGDGTNDISMFKVCGKGVAISTGSEMLIEAADYVCPPIENGGIYDICVELGLIKPIDSKVFFFDIDGTTYSHKLHDNPPSTKAALRKLKEKGNKLFICTSRSLDEMQMLPKDFVGIMDGIICLAGAQRIVEGEHRLLKMDDSAKECMRYLDEQGVTYRYVTTNEEGYINQPDEDKEALFYRLYRMTPPTKPYENEDLIQVLAYVTNQEQIAYIEEHFKNLCMIKFNHAIELTAGIMDKGEAIKEVTEQLGYSEKQSVAFGDGFNDATMLKNAYLGIALGNAAPITKAAADYVTDDIDEDGLYNACVHFKFIEE